MSNLERVYLLSSELRLEFRKTLSNGYIYGTHRKTDKMLSELADWALANMVSNSQELKDAMDEARHDDQSSD